MSQPANAETTVFRGSPSLATRFGALLLAALLIIGGVIGGFTLAPPFNFISGGVAAAALIFFAVTALLVKSTHYEVTTQRVRRRCGILTKRTDEIELYRANDTALIEPLGLRIFGLGTIEIRTSDASTPVLYLNAVHGARDLREQLRVNIEQCRDRKRVRVTEFDQPDEPPAVQ